MVAKQTTQTKPAFPDFYQASNNCVMAVYPVSADILKREGPALMKVPFLFYVGTTKGTAAELSARMRTYVQKGECWEGGAAPHYFSGSDLDRMLEGTITRHDLDPSVKLPETIEIVPGRVVNTNDLASWWVPYSFGIGHENDVKTHTKFRTPADYDRMVNVVLPDVLAERKYMQEQTAQQAVEAAKLGNRVRAVFGMYQPKTVAYEPRVDVHRGWR